MPWKHCGVSLRNKAMKKTYKFRYSMAVNIIGAMVLLIALFGVINGAIGLISFTKVFRNEYAVTTYHMADTATTLINGDHVDDYLEGKETEEYERTNRMLDVFCHRMSVSLVYVIMVDRSDYGRFVSVFNCVDNTVDDSSYVPWELGHKRDTTNDEYRQKYKEIYEQEADYETVYRIKTTDGQHPHITTIVPVKNSAGETAAILCIQRPFREFLSARRPYIVNIAISTAMLAVISSVFASLVIRRQFIAPVKRISDEATRFAKENTKGEPLGPISRFEEISSLAMSIDTMEHDMVNYIENMTKITAERERISAELSLASTIQENSIPSIFPAFPERSDFDIYGSMTPAREVGGDFYNFFMLDDDRLVMIIGDVSGKGVPAALFMMVTDILVSDQAHLGGSPGEALTFANNIICVSNKADMFVTVWLGILELSTGRLVAANAGHEYPAVRQADGRFELYRDPHGFVIGGMENTQYKEYELYLKPGSRLFLYTDGVPEATDAEEKMFGLDRMLRALNEDESASPKEILGNVRKAVDGFVKDAEQFDDMTMLCISYEGPEKHSAETGEKGGTAMNCLDIEASKNNLPQVLSFVDELLEACDCPMKKQMEIDLAVEEIFINIASYAYEPDTGNAVICVDTAGDPKTAVIVFKDRGIPYNPLSKEDPDITLSAEERSIGGLGIFMTKKVMDEITYDYRDGQNILTLKKRL